MGGSVTACTVPAWQDSRDAEAKPLPMRGVRLAAAAGLLSAVVMTVGWIVAGLLQSSSYSWTAQEISDLGALTAQHAWVWNLADSLSGVLLTVFAVGVFWLMGSSRSGRIGAVLIGVVGLGSLLDGLVREDCPLSTSPACQRLQDGPGLSWHHQAHDIESVIVFTAMLIAPFVLARAFTQIDGLRDLSAYSRVTGIALVAATAAYLPLYGNDGGGIAQRAIALLFMAWIAALAWFVLRGAGRAAEGRPSPD
jgi:hypothetical membrane protein